MSNSFLLRCSQAPFLRFAMAGSVAVLGRSSNCDFVVDEPSVSRRHAEIRVGDSALIVSDLGSKNGTYVDGVRVEKGDVSVNQVVSFGNVRFVVMVEEREVARASSDDETDQMSDEVDGKEHTLTDAQRRVFELLVSGLPEKTISRRLNISKHTVHTHTTKIFKVFGVHSRAELVASLFKPLKGGVAPAITQFQQ